MNLFSKKYRKKSNGIEIVLKGRKKGRGDEIRLEK